MKEDANILFVKKTAGKVSLINSGGNFKFILGAHGTLHCFDLSFNIFVIRAKFLPVSTSG